MGRIATLAALAALLVPGMAEAFVVLSTAGCEPKTGARWRELPSPWHLWHEGYDLIPTEEVEEIFQASAAIWGAPCCSGFEAVYMGTTDVERLGGAENVISFVQEHRAWPPTWGHRRATIAVTIPSISRVSCEIRRSDMVFNGDGFTFRTDGRSTDLQAIATHEFGHWIGLDHTTVYGATMLPYYQGGTRGREPNWDDQAGACFLYPTPCPCTEDGDCKVYESCEDGLCLHLPCEKNADCPDTSTCLDGSCEPGCKFHTDCRTDEWCADGVCTERYTECKVCDRCTANSQCGPADRGYQCAGMEVNSGQCTKGCSNDNDCPGDSVCLKDWQLCGSPEPPVSWICDQNYSCTFAPMGCDHLGDSCTSPDGCGGTSDTCVDALGDDLCSCSCRLDSDCGPDGACLRNHDTGRRACYPKAILEPCGHFYCHPGESCIPGELRCGIDHCKDVVCGAGEVCRLGACVDPCEGVVCMEGYACEAGSCVPGAPGDESSGKAPKKKSGCAAGSDDGAGGWLWIGFLVGIPLLSKRRSKPGVR